VHVVEVRELDRVTVDDVQQRDDPHLLEEFEGALVPVPPGLEGSMETPAEALTAGWTRARVQALCHVDTTDRGDG